LDKAIWLMFFLLADRRNGGSERLLIGAVMAHMIFNAAAGSSFGPALPRSPPRALSSALMLAALERSRYPASSLSRPSRRGRDRYERSGSWQGNIFEQITSSSTVTYLHHDQQGPTRLLTSPTGTGSTGTSTTPLGYDAQIHQPAPGQ
jgi:hypothetical protein